MDSAKRQAFLAEFNALCHKHGVRIDTRCYGEWAELIFKDIDGPGMYREGIHEIE